MVTIDSNQTPEGELIDVLKRNEARKLSQRSTGKIIYELGRLNGELYIRIAENDSGGKFSKEWVPLTSILNCLPVEPGPFHASRLAAAFQKRSQNNPGFLAAVLRAEGVLIPDSEKVTLNREAPGFQSWRIQALELVALRTEPRNPLKQKAHKVEDQGEAENPPQDPASETETGGLTEEVPEETPAAEPPAEPVAETEPYMEQQQESHGHGRKKKGKRQKTADDAEQEHTNPNETVLEGAAPEADSAAQVMVEPEIE
jgi:hypothetical protein